MDIKTIAKKLFGELGIAVFIANIRFGSNLATKTIEIEIAKERLEQNQKLYIKLTIGIDKIPDEVVKFLSSTSGQVIVGLAVVLLIILTLLADAVVAGVAMLATIIKALGKSLG